MSSAAVQAGISRFTGIQNHNDEPAKGTLDENMTKVAPKTSAESKLRPAIKRSVPVGTLTKPPKEELIKDDNKTGKAVGRIVGPSSTSEKDFSTHPSEGRQGGAANICSALTANVNTIPASAKGSNASARISMEMHGSISKTDGVAAKPSELRVSAGKDPDNEVSEVPRPLSSQPAHSPGPDDSFTTSKSADKQQKRTSPAQEHNRLNKRRKGDAEVKDLEGEVRFPDREKSMDPRLADKPHPVDLDKAGTDEQSHSRTTDKLLDRTKDKGTGRYDRNHRERLERPDKSRGDDILAEKSRDRSMERCGREHLVERVQERN